MATEEYDNRWVSCCDSTVAHCDLVRRWRVSVNHPRTPQVGPFGAWGVLKGKRRGRPQLTGEWSSWPPADCSWPLACGAARSRQWPCGRGLRQVLGVLKLRFLKPLLSGGWIFLVGLAGCRGCMGSPGWVSWELGQLLSPDSLGFLEGWDLPLYVHAGVIIAGVARFSGVRD